MREELSNPPINELIIGVYFNPPMLDIYTHHIGIFWEKIRDSYPLVEQRDPINNVFVEVPNEMFPMPRFWFTSRDGSHLAQVQRNAFLLNWRRRDSAYPSYDPVKLEFDRVFGIFTGFVRSIRPDAPITIDRAELTYINLIEQSDYWRGPTDTAIVVPSYQPLAGSLPTAFAVQQTTKHDERTSVAIALRLLERRPESVLNLQLEIRAIGQLGGATKAGVDEWFEAAHDLTGNTFRSITNAAIRESYWNKGASHAR